MPNYTLFNASTNTKLKHPRVGLWFTNSLPEAREMLEACYKYLDAVNIPSMKEHIVIQDADTEEIVR